MAMLNNQRVKPNTTQWHTCGEGWCEIPFDKRRFHRVALLLNRQHGLFAIICCNPSMHRTFNQPGSPKRLDLGCCKTPRASAPESNLQTCLPTWQLERQPAFRVRRVDDPAGWGSGSPASGIPCRHAPAQHFEAKHSPHIARSPGGQVAKAFSLLMILMALTCLAALFQHPPKKYIERVYMT